MLTEFSEVQFSGEQEDERTDDGEVRVTEGLALGGLPPLSHCEDERFDVEKPDRCT
jgi:hypothetical protein